MKLCECGCGQEVAREGNRFIHNHHLRGRIPSEESRRKVSISLRQYYADGGHHPLKGRSLSEETRRQISEKAKARLADPKNHPWYGRHHSEEAKRKIGASNRHQPSEVRKRQSETQKRRLADPRNHPMYGRKHSTESKIKMSQWQVGRKLTTEHKKNINLASKKLWQDPNRRKAILAKIHTPQSAAKASVMMKKLWRNPEYRDRQVIAMVKARNIHPNRCEALILGLLDEICPGTFQFDDGCLVLDGLIPDFVREDRKQIIEFFGDYWHGKEKTGMDPESHERKRIECFRKKGWETLVIWEHELDNLNLVRLKIRQFVVR